MFATIFHRCFNPLAPACLYATGGKTLSTIACSLFPLILVAGFGGDAFAQATVPGAPVLREVDLGNGQLTVTWRAPENTGSGIDRYKVTADPGTSDSPSDDTTCPSTETGGTATTCTLTGLTNGTAYTVRVVATNSAGDSTPSFSAVATPSIQDAGGKIYVYPNGRTHFVRYPKLDPFLHGVLEGNPGVDLPEYFPVRILLNPDSVDVVKRFLSDNGARGIVAWKGDDVGQINAAVTASLLVPLSKQPGVGRVDFEPPPGPLSIPDPMRLDTTSAMAHKAIAWHSAGYDGTGVKVGVIDIGFQNFRTTLSEVGFDTTLIRGARCYRDRNSLDTTSAVADCENTTDHGTKVTQSLLHIAPEVSLYISNASKRQLRDAVKWMKDQGVRVINHSVAHIWDGPGDGTSPFYDSPLNIVETAVADSIIWINAAGNAARATWYSTSPIWTSSSKLAFDSAGDTCNAIELKRYTPVLFQLRWKGNRDSTSWKKANIDLALYLLNSAGTVVYSSNKPQRGGGDGTYDWHYPLEWIYYTSPSNGSYCLMVEHLRDTGPDWVQLQVMYGIGLDDDLEHTDLSGGSIVNPAESKNAGMLAVGAAHYSSRAIEPFSSRGPTRDGLRIKPDIVGADGYKFPAWPYALKGTSYGSPHVAGLAALVIDRYENDANYDTPAEIAAYLKNNARDMGIPGADNTWGHGFAELPALPTATLVLSPASISENGGMTTVTATLDRTATTATTITVSAAVSPAASGDFTLSTATTLTIAANATTSTGVVTITANDNVVRAVPKSVTVSGTVTGVVPPAAVTLTITDDDTPVSIPDANLRAVILDSLDKTNTDTIRVSDMLRLTRLDAPNKGIRDLAGLEFATSLYRLDFGYEIYPVNSNAISDLSPLAGLTNLTMIQLGGNSISDIDTLASLTNLTYLELSGNSITDISPLRGLTNLTWLWFSSSNLSDISALRGLTSLTYMNLSNNNLTDTDISSLSGLINLTGLNLGSNRITDISSLQTLTSLTRLWLYDNSISDISALRGLTSLTTLNLWNNSISDISALRDLTSLTYLELGGNNIPNISILSNLTSLTTLLLWSNSLTDISALSGLTNLTELYLNSNRIKDISRLSGLTKLTTLNLAWNSIINISSLSGLDSLKTLLLDHNRISNLAPLVSNTGLGSGDYVDVRGNPLSALSRTSYIPTLTGTSRGVTVVFDSLSVARLVKVSGDGQMGTARTALAKPFVVKVQSANDTTYAYRHLPVTFSVTPGGGSLSATSDTTDYYGLARTLLTLGETVGMDTVKAFIEGASDTLIFTTLSPLPTPDFDGNGRVNFADFLALGNKMGSGRDRGSYEARYDLDGDGEIGMSDFRILTSRFGDGKFDDAK